MRRERVLDGVKRCQGCTDRKPGCKDSCEDQAVRNILDAIALPEMRAAVKLGFDLNGVKRRDIMRNARKKHNSRRQ